MAKIRNDIAKVRTTLYVHDNPTSNVPRGSIDRRGESRKITKNAGKPDAITRSVQHRHSIEPRTAPFAWFCSVEYESVQCILRNGTVVLLEESAHARPGTTWYIPRYIRDVDISTWNCRLGVESVLSRRIDTGSDEDRTK